MNFLPFDLSAAAHNPWLLLAVAGIVFLETAIIFLSFLPGDTLLFVLGVTLAQVASWGTSAFAVSAVMVAAVAGSQVGYWIGQSLGEKFLHRQKETRHFNADTVKRTHEFFEKYGARAVILARFVPVLRAVVPVVAGIGKLERRSFFVFNVAGAVIWSVGVTTVGFLLGGVPFVHKYFEFVILAAVGVSALPVAAEVVRRALKKRPR